MSWALGLAVVMNTAVAASSGGLAYERTGTGPGIVLLHSLGGDRSVWKDEAPRLAKTHIVLNVDLPGHGKSPAPARVDFAEIAKQITQLIRKEKLAPAVVIGHSIGGTIAAWTPVADPGAVKAVLIVDSSIAPLPWPPETIGEVRQSFAANYDQGLRAFFARIANGDVQVERLTSLARHVRPDTFLAYLDFAAHHSMVNDAAKIQVPVEMIASGIYFDTADHQKELAEGGYAGLRNFSSEVVPGTKHWLYWDQPQAYARLVDAFLARVESHRAESPERAGAVRATNAR